MGRFNLWAAKVRAAEEEKRFGCHSVYSHLHMGRITCAGSYVQRWSSGMLYLYCGVSLKLMSRFTEVVLLFGLLFQCSSISFVFFYCDSHFLAPELIYFLTYIYREAFIKFSSFITAEIRHVKCYGNMCNYQVFGTLGIAVFILTFT